MSLIVPSRHPMVSHKLAALRDLRTPPPAFRGLIKELAALLAHEATADLPTREVVVHTPLGPCPSRVLADSVAIVPILRAGLGMAEGLLELIPEAEVWHVGLSRDEHTLQPHEYYNKIRDRCRASFALVVDPMLATGGSAVRTCEIVRAAGVQNVKLLVLIASPEGLDRVARTLPDVPIHVAAIDERLTEVGFIYPGLGDAGDRQFATPG